MKIYHLDKDFYNELAQELITELWDNNRTEGVIEIVVKTHNSQSINVLFAYNANDYTLGGGLASLTFLLLAFDENGRCSTDFQDEKIAQIINI
ncbi:MAG: hypothetical protein R3Y49_00690 [Rikenellaceae bacterium]